MGNTSRKLDLEVPFVAPQFSQNLAEQEQARVTAKQKIKNYSSEKAQSAERYQMNEAEVLLARLFSGKLSPEFFGQVMPFHCIDARYKKCRKFMERFYPLGYGGFAAGPTAQAIGDSFSTLCFLTGEEERIETGKPLALVIGEHEDCGFSKKESGSREKRIVETCTFERTNQTVVQLLKRPDIGPAVESGRVVLLVTRTTFLEAKDGSYTVLYETLPERTNALLKRAQKPKLSRQFTEKFSRSVYVFGAESANCG